MSAEEEVLYIGGGKRTIYLIDPDVDLLKKLGNLLVETYPNYEIVATDNLGDARDEVKITKPTVIITSFEMGNGSNSLDFIKEIRTHQLLKDVPIMIIDTRAVMEKNASEFSRWNLEMVPKAIRIPYFLGVLDGCLKQAQSIDAKTIQLSAGEYLFKEGEISDSIYVLKSGKLKVVKEDNGEVFDLAELEGLQLIGEMAFLDKRPRSATVKAMDDSVLLQLNLGDVDSFIDQQPFWLGMMLKTLITRLRETNEKILDMSQSS